MTRSFIDKDQAVATLRASLPPLVEVIRNIKDPDATAIGKWSARDVASHLVDVSEDHQNAARGLGTGASSSAEITDFNQERIEARGATDVRELANLLDKEMTAYIDYLAGIEGDPIVAWTDMKVPLTAVIAADIAECVIHGLDIARSQERPWHIDPKTAALATRGVSPLAVDYVDKDAAAGLDACFDLRMRGEWSHHYVFKDGELAIEEPSDRRVDVHISADPVAFMLVGYGRVSQWGPIATGKLLAWGRKPWLALRFGSLLRNP